MNNVAEDDDQNLEHYYEDLTVGEILRRTRVHYNLTLDQVEAAVRIRAIQLDAIEQMEVHRLPGRVYAIGFVRTYAEYLGLDAGRMVHLFKSQSIGHKPREDVEKHFPVMAHESQVPGVPIIVGGLIGCVLLIVAWSVLYKDTGPVVDEIPPVPPEAFEESITEAPPIGIEQTRDATMGPAPERVQVGPVLEPKPKPSLPPERPERRVIFHVHENSWVEIRGDQGDIVLRQILKAGDEYLVPDKEGLVMTTGNAGGFTILVDGKEIPKLGRSAQVRRNISLNPVDLLKNVEN